MATFSTNVTHREMLNVIRVLWFTPGRGGYNPNGDTDPVVGIPFFVLDEPGTGKTSIMRQFALGLGIDHVEEITMTQRSAEDIGGYGIPNRTRDAINKVPDACFLRVNDAKRALLVFDEFGSVEDDKRAACLRVTSERAAGDVRIGGHVRMVAVGNPESSAANGNPIDPATANRYAHVPWIAPSVDEFSDWLLGGANDEPDPDLHADAIEARMADGWESAFANAAGLTTAYLRRFKDHLHQTPVGNGDDPSTGETDQLRWPSRRVWEYMTRALAGASILGLSAVETDFLIHCFLPAGVATKFAAFVRDADMPLPEDVLDGRVAFEPSGRMDRTDAVLRATASVLVSQRNREHNADAPDTITPQLRDRAVRWWKLCAAVKDAPYGGRDFVVGPASMVSRSMDKQGAGLNKDLIPEAGPVVGDLYDVLVARLKVAK